MKKIEEYVALITGDIEKQKILSDIIFSGIAVFVYIVFLVVTSLGENLYNYICSAPNTDIQLFYWIKMIFFAGTIIRLIRVVVLDFILFIKDCLKAMGASKCIFV